MPSARRGLRGSLSATQPSNRKRGGASRYQQSTPSTGVTPESSPTPLPAALSIPQQQELTSATVVSPESVPESVPLASPATVAPPESSPAHPPSVSEVLVPQQQQPRVSPTVTRSAVRQRVGLGPRHGFVSKLAARENVAMIIDLSPPHIPAPELTSCTARGLVTPDSQRKHASINPEICGLKPWTPRLTTCSARRRSVLW